MKTLSRVYDTYGQARQVVAELKSAGIARLEGQPCRQQACQRGIRRRRRGLGHCDRCRHRCDSGWGRGTARRPRHDRDPGHRSGRGSRLAGGHVGRRGRGSRRRWACRRARRRRPLQGRRRGLFGGGSPWRNTGHRPSRGHFGPHRPVDPRRACSCRSAEAAARNISARAGTVTTRVPSLTISARPSANVFGLPIPAERLLDFRAVSPWNRPAKRRLRYTP